MRHFFIGMLRVCSSIDSIFLFFRLSSYILQSLDALKVTGHLASEEFELTDQRTQFLHRFAPFTALETPTVPTYDHYLEKTNLAALKQQPNLVRRVSCNQKQFLTSSSIACFAASGCKPRVCGGHIRVRTASRRIRRNNAKGYARLCGCPCFRFQTQHHHVRSPRPRLIRQGFLKKIHRLQLTLYICRSDFRSIFRSMCNCQCSNLRNSKIV
jgi:hypothetical protein